MKAESALRVRKQEVERDRWRVDGADDGPKVVPGTLAVDRQRAIDVRTRREQPFHPIVTVTNGLAVHLEDVAKRHPRLIALGRDDHEVGDERAGRRRLCAIRRSRDERLRVPLFRYHRRHGQVIARYVVAGASEHDLQGRLGSLQDPAHARATNKYTRTDPD